MKYWYGKDNTVEMEPLMLIPPRFFIEVQNGIVGAVNTKLTHLIQHRLDVPMSETDRTNPDFQDLNHLPTPTGFSLQTRYTNLSITVAEGLAGTNDPFLRQELIRQAEDNRNPLSRATALLSLAYNGNNEDIVLISKGLSSPEPLVRFGAMEAVQVGHFENLIGELLSIANSDPNPAFRLFAMQVLIHFENPIGRQLLLTHLNDPDWPARAMAFWYVGRYGTTQDFGTVIGELSTEQNPFVKAEIALALQRLAP